jgi:SAM-dependent methyltransferase
MRSFPPSHWARRRRFALLVRLVQSVPPLDRPLRLLDVGGTYTCWQHMNWSAFGRPVDVTLLNVRAQHAAPPFTAIVGDARNLSHYADGAFDVVFSQSTIGHVGSLLDQACMAAEIQRVGQRFLLQTPNQGCPIDWQTRLPFVHWLRPPRQARNLTKRELAGLFPHARIHHERVLGVTKSFVVIGP